jgi:hypothetical protein
MQKEVRLKRVAAIFSSALLILKFSIFLAFADLLYFWFIL